MQPDKWRTWLGLGLVFILASFLVYFPALNLPLLADDYLFCHPLLLHQQLTHWGGAAGGSGVFFRPIVVFSYYLDAALWPQNSLGYHALNLVLHGLNALGVFWLSFLWQKRFSVSARPIGSAIITGLLFLILPSHTESVAWVSGRTDLLMTFFGLSALAFGTLYLTGGLTRYMALSLAAMSAALFSKENALALNLIFLVIGGLWLRAFGAQSERVWRFGLLAALWALCSLVFWIVRFSVLRQWIGGYGPHLYSLDVWKILLNVSIQIVRIFLPALPSAWVSFFSPAMAAAFFWAILIAAAWAVFMRFKSKAAVWHWPAGLAAALVCSLLPTLSMPVQLFATDGERLLYLPSVFACMLFIRWIRPFAGQPRRTAIVLGLLALLLVGLQLSISRWVQAGRLFKTLVAEASLHATRPRLLVLNLPASLGGAHMFISGLAIAMRFQALADLDLELFQRINQLKEIQFFSLHDVYSPGESLRVDLAPTSAVLTLLAPGACFRTLPWSPTSEGIAVVRQTYFSVSFAFPDGLPENAVVLYFNQGHLHALTSPP